MKIVPFLISRWRLIDNMREITKIRDDTGRGTRANHPNICLKINTRKEKKNTSIKKKDIHWVNKCSCSISLNDNERWCNSVDKYL